ncbi:MAG: hypothetical protein GY801_16105 [bacterium]|nr:hypothetical protein [bacterium]
MLKQRFSRVCPCEASSERANAMPQGRRGGSARWTLRLPPCAKAPLQHSSFIPGIIKEPFIYKYTQEALIVSARDMDRKERKRYAKK